jgi:hypothetical protein
MKMRDPWSLIAAAGLAIWCCLVVGCASAEKIVTAQGRGGYVEVPGENGQPGYKIHASDNTSVEYLEWYPDGTKHRHVTKRPETVVLARANGAIEIERNQAQNAAFLGETALGLFERGLALGMGTYREYQQAKPPPAGGPTGIEKLEAQLGVVANGLNQLIELQKKAAGGTTTQPSP